MDKFANILLFNVADAQWLAGSASPALSAAGDTGVVAVYPDSASSLVCEPRDHPLKGAAVTIGDNNYTTGDQSNFQKTCLRSGIAIFTHFKLWLASARDNLKWVKNAMSSVVHKSLLCSVNTPL